MKCGWRLRGTDPAAYWIRPTWKKSTQKTKPGPITELRRQKKLSNMSPKQTSKKQRWRKHLSHECCSSINTPASAVSCFRHGNKSECPEPATSGGLMSQVITAKIDGTGLFLPNDLSVFTTWNVTDVVRTHSSCCNVYKNEEVPF